jgi:hypothetical protein
MTDSPTTRTVWDIRPGEQLLIGGRKVSVELIHKSGQLARLQVIAPPDVSIEKGGQLRSKHGEMTP